LFHTKIFIDVARVDGVVHAVVAGRDKHILKPCGQSLHAFGVHTKLPDQVQVEPEPKHAWCDQQRQRQEEKRGEE
jgi:hypothetical protein